MRKVFLFVVVLGFPFLAFSQKNTYQGLFIYQFSKYVKWPDSYGNGAFVIDVFGDDDVFKDISHMAAVKGQTQGMDIVVRKLQNVGEVSNPHIIFIQKEYSNVLGSLLQKIKSEPILIVTESPGLMDKGSIINFVDKDGKMRFEINETKAQSVGLKISGSLVSLAVARK